MEEFTVVEGIKYMVETSILAMFELTTISPRKTQDNFNIIIQISTLLNKKKLGSLVFKPKNKYWFKAMIKNTHGFES